MKLEQISAVVSGGASGLGEAVVRAVVEAGGTATILDLNRERGELLSGELGDSTLFVKTDVTSAEEVQGAIDRHLEKFGKLNFAVNCAGIAPPFRTVKKDGTPAPLEKFEKVISVNLVGTYNVLRLSAAAMFKNEPNSEGERGVIVNTASIAAFDGQVGQAAYAASKGGIASMTLPLAREFARFGIRVVTVAPGIFDTPLMAGLPEKARETLAQQVPFPKRLGKPAEFASLVLQIAKNMMLNGEIIRLDGALRMP